MKLSNNIALVVVPFLLLIFPIWVYWAGLHGSFVFDDFPNIVHNAILHEFSGSFESLVSAATSGTSSPLGRPLSMASFAMNLYYFGENPFSFKVANLAIHITNATLLAVFVRQLCIRVRSPNNSLYSLIPPIWIATTWVLHPINLTPVLFVVQRMTSLSAFFMLAALTSYLYGRENKSIRGIIALAVSIIVFWPAAILSKETGILFPIYVLLIEWLIVGSLKLISVKLKWVFFLASILVLVIFLREKWHLISPGYSVRNFDLSERILTESRVLWFYVYQILMPRPELFGLFHDDIEISRSLISPSLTLVAVFAWVGLVALAFQQRERRPLFAFGVFWFLVSHSLESTVLPLEIAYEHRNYLAFIGLYLWIAIFLFPGQEKKRWEMPRLFFAASFIVACGLITSLRSLQWSDEFQRSQAEVGHHPDSARANYQAATVILQRTYESRVSNPFAYQMVQFHFKRAAELNSDAKAPLVGLLYLDCLAGLPKNVTTLSSARKRFALGRFGFEDRGVVQSLSGFFVENRLCLDDLDVTSVIDAALSNPTADGPMRGLIYATAMDFAALKKQDISLAVSYARSAILNDQGSIPFRVNLINLYLHSNQVNLAMQEYKIIETWKIPLRDRHSVNKLRNDLEALEQNAKM